MSIVTELRNMSTACGYCVESPLENDLIPRRAADEIERLRAALDRFDEFLTAKLPDGTSWWSMTPIEVLQEWIKAREALRDNK